MTLQVANNLTAFSYLNGDIGKTALKYVQISGSSAIKKSSEITGFFYRRDAILLYKIIQQLYFLPPLICY